MSWNRKKENKTFTIKMIIRIDWYIKKLDLDDLYTQDKGKKERKRLEIKSTSTTDQKETEALNTKGGVIIHQYILHQRL